MNLSLLLSIVTFVVILTALGRVNVSWSLTKRMLSGMVLGIPFELVPHLVYGDDGAALKQSISWSNIVGGDYIQLLQMTVMLLVLVSVLNSVAKFNSTASFGKISVLTIGTLLLAIPISALVGVFVTHPSGLTAQGLVQGVRETAWLTAAQDNYVGKAANLLVSQLVQSFTPKNLFVGLTGAKSMSIIGVVILAAFLNVAALNPLRDDAVKGERVLTIIDTAQAWVMKLVRLVIRLTPHGVLALMTNAVAVSNVQDIIKPDGFVVAPYLDLTIMFGMHAVLLTLNGINPFRFFRKVWPTLSLVLMSRPSVAAIPLSIEAQTRRIGVSESITGFAVSFGTTIGQSDCTGLYPVMLAATVAPTVDTNPFGPVWIAMLMTAVTLSSVSAAGVGGGATFTASIVLLTMGLSVTFVVLLIFIKPPIDMDRTALNVDGSTTARAITGQLLGQTDRSVFDAADDVEMAYR